ncbi:hypothetical protein KCP78_11125 [Salmonella enterica subsp. enterica]|nr:hypothetical protein KCP78_11125 [Salmonella enterica subsp. enterica]
MSIPQRRLAAGKRHLRTPSSWQSPAAAGVFIILQGVRLILAEIVPAFGPAFQKTVKTRPALDCPVVYPHAPNGTSTGFPGSVFSAAGGLFPLGQMKFVLILPLCCTYRRASQAFWQCHRRSPRAMHRRIC